MNVLFLSLDDSIQRRASHNTWNKYVLVIHCLKKVYATFGACILSTASRGRRLRKRSESIKAGEKTSLLFMSLVNTFLIRLWSQSSASSLTDYSMMFILYMMSHFIWYSNRWSVCVVYYSLFVSKRWWCPKIISQGLKQDIAEEWLLKPSWWYTEVHTVWNEEAMVLFIFTL